MIAEGEVGQEVWAIVDFFHCTDYSMKPAISSMVENAAGKTEK